MPLIDFKSLEIDAITAADGDPDEELSIEALQGRAIQTLLDSLGASSEDVKRKAATDILNFNKSNTAQKPTVTEEQLEYLGRIIVETEAVRLRLDGSERSTRLLEGPGTN